LLPRTHLIVIFFFIELTVEYHQGGVQIEDGTWSANFSRDHALFDKVLVIDEDNSSGEEEIDEEEKQEHTQKRESLAWDEFQKTI